MPVVNILLTHSEADSFEPFRNGATTYQFSQLVTQGPQQVLEGDVWIFIDWVLEDLAGLELCRRMRAEPTMAPAHITMVLEEGEALSRKRALDAGADDYIVGPIDRRMILDRVLALNPEAQAPYSANMLEYGPLVFNLASHRAFWNDTPIEISPNEFRLLRFLAENANLALSRAEIVAGLGRNGEDIDERTVDVWIGRLRKAIKAAGGGRPVRTVRSVGYVFDL